VGADNVAVTAPAVADPSNNANPANNRQRLLLSRPVPSEFGIARPMLYPPICLRDFGRRIGTLPQQADNVATWAS
jgi:hypothetical protein